MSRAEGATQQGGAGAGSGEPEAVIFNPWYDFPVVLLGVASDASIHLVTWATLLASINACNTIGSFFVGNIGGNVNANMQIKLNKFQFFGPVGGQCTISVYNAKYVTTSTIAATASNGHIQPVNLSGAADAILNQYYDSGTNTSRPSLSGHFPKNFINSFKANDVVVNQNRNILAIQSSLPTKSATSDESTLYIWCSIRSGENIVLPSGPSITRKLENFALCLDNERFDELSITDQRRVYEIYQENKELLTIHCDGVALPTRIDYIIDYVLGLEPPRKRKCITGMQ